MPVRPPSTINDDFPTFGAATTQSVRNQFTAAQNDINALFAKEEAGGASIDEIHQWLIATPTPPHTQQINIGRIPVSQINLPMSQITAGTVPTGWSGIANPTGSQIPTASWVLGQVGGEAATDLDLVNQWLTTPSMSPNPNGTIAAGRIPTLPASQINSGTFALARLGGGTVQTGYVLKATSSTVANWQAESGGGGWSPGELVNQNFNVRTPSNTTIDIDSGTAPMSSGQALGLLNFRGHTTANTWVNGLTIQAVATGSWSPTSQPTRVDFNVRNASGGSDTALQLESGGKVMVGTPNSTPAWQSAPRGAINVEHIFVNGIAFSTWIQNFIP